MKWLITYFIHNLSKEIDEDESENQGWNFVINIIVKQSNFYKKLDKKRRKEVLAIYNNKTWTINLMDQVFNLWLQFQPKKIQVRINIKSNS